MGRRGGGGHRRRRDGARSLRRRRGVGRALAGGGALPGDDRRAGASRVLGHQSSDRWVAPVRVDRRGRRRRAVRRGPGGVSRRRRAGRRTRRSAIRDRRGPRRGRRSRCSPAAPSPYSGGHDRTDRWPSGGGRRSIRTGRTAGRCSACGTARNERRMYVQIASQSVAAHAETLLRGYVSPFTGARGTDNPLVFAGFVLTNSETGHGSFSITRVWSRRSAPTATRSRGTQCARCTLAGSSVRVSSAGPPTPSAPPSTHRQAGHRRHRYLPDHRLPHPPARPPADPIRHPNRRRPRHHPLPQLAAAVHRRPAERDPRPLPRRRPAHRRRHPPSRHQRRPTPRRRRHRLRHGTPRPPRHDPRQHPPALASRARTGARTAAPVRTSQLPHMPMSAHLGSRQGGRSYRFWLGRLV